MAFYNYYQQYYPQQWGQQQYYNQFLQNHFAAPPVPTYQPQPNWTGFDYYNAHYAYANNGYDADGNDLTFFNYVWDKIRGRGRAGVGREEARHWHHRVYSGLTEVSNLLPSDMGAAAGYEAFRATNHHRSVYLAPLAGDYGREDEALAGLAIAEATKLWSLCGRPTDKYGRYQASEVAAATALRIMRRQRRRERERERDYGDSMSVYSYNSDDEPAYGYDDGYYGGSGSKRRSSMSRRLRRRSSGANMMYPYAAAANAGAYPSGYVPGTSMSYTGATTTPYVYPTYAASTATAGGSYYPTQTAAGYPGAYVQQPQAGLVYPGTPGMGAGGLAVPGAGMRPRASSFGAYPGGSYM